MITRSDSNAKVRPHANKTSEGGNGRRAALMLGTLKEKKTEYEFSFQFWQRLLTKRHENHLYFCLLFAQGEHHSFLTLRSSVQHLFRAQEEVLYSKAQHCEAFTSADA